MPLITFNPAGIKIEVEKGTLLQKAFARAGLFLSTPCGGKGKCGKCLVKIQGKVGSLSRAEEILREKGQLAEGFRLACQICVQEDICVEYLADSFLHKAKILEESLVKAKRSFLPQIRVISLGRPADDAAFGHIADWSWLKKQIASTLNDELYHEKLVINFGLLRCLPDLLRQSEGTLFAVLAGSEVIALSPSAEAFGVAFDIGTTTLVAYLVDLNSGRIINVQSCSNPQYQFGADVISRIMYTLENESGLQLMQQKVVNAMNGLLERLCSTEQISTQIIYELVAVGNTTMMHLLLGVEPRQLVLAPYTPALTNSLYLDAQQLGLRINPQGKIYILPAIGSFLGADTVAAILATDFARRKDPAILVDLGTNGEVAAINGGKIISCSTAAGPAFEGVNISCGMPAAEGAIDHFYLHNGELSYTVIGNIKPRGICGSALVDLVALLRDYNIINKRGKMLERDEAGEAPLSWRNRLQRRGGVNEFIIEKAQQTLHNEPLSLTQKDVRELQMAKAAIRAGIKILQQELNFTDRDTAELVVCGAFGNYIDMENAIKIGLLPDIAGKINPVGNAAGAGAKIALVSVSAREEADLISAGIQKINLSEHADFQKIFFRNFILGKH